MDPFQHAVVLCLGRTRDTQHEIRPDVPSPMSQAYSTNDVEGHKNEKDLWIVIDTEVYDLSGFVDSHPGGKKILLRVGGKDASKQFWKYHNEAILNKYKPKLKVGQIGEPKSGGSEKLKAAKQRQPAAVPEERTAAPLAPAQIDVPEAFGDMVPYGDPNWYQGWRSPYYNSSHVALREEVRQWMDEKVQPNLNEWDEQKFVPPEIYREMGARGWLAGALGIHYPTQYTDIRVKTVKPEEWDHFHEFILTDEISRSGSGGFVWSMIGGYGIGGPPVIKFAQEEVKKRVMPGLLSGEKRICLCITEPDAGSDVANLATEAKKTPDGKHYIVNGEKKWITNGIWSDYFTVAVRTGGPGMNGVSVLLVEKTMPGVNVRKMDCQGVWASGTTYVTFGDVKVPVENLIGKENKGFKVLMTNFNHERMGIIIQCGRFARVCYEEAMKYAHKRETFGKKLIEHPVIRLKLAHMARQIEATHAAIENLVYQSVKMGDEEAMYRLGGAIAGLKAQSTTVFEFAAREASQIFGGLAVSRGGQGAKVERLYRDVRSYAIPGGSEEVSVRHSVKLTALDHVGPVYTASTSCASSAWRKVVAVNFISVGSGWLCTRRTRTKVSSQVCRAANVGLWTHHQI